MTGGSVDEALIAYNKVHRAPGHSCILSNYSVRRNIRRGRKERYRLRGRPSTRSARLFRNTSHVPASIVFARERRNWASQPSPPPTSPPPPPTSTAVSTPTPLHPPPIR